MTKEKKLENLMEEIKRWEKTNHVKPVPLKEVRRITSKVDTKLSELVLERRRYKV